MIVLRIGLPLFAVAAIAYGSAMAQTTTPAPAGPAPGATAPAAPAAVSPAATPGNDEGEDGGSNEQDKD